MIEKRIVREALRLSLQIPGGEEPDNQKNVAEFFSRINKFRRRSKSLISRILNKLFTLIQTKIQKLFV